MSTARTPRRSGDGFLRCSDGHVRWGRFGAAGVVFTVVDGDGPLVLLQLRSAFAHEGGTWSCPGGAIDEGESPLEAALREASEEVGDAPEVEIDGEGQDGSDDEEGDAASDTHEESFRGEPATECRGPPSVSLKRY